MVAEGHEEFLNKVIDLKDDERTEEWHDAWSPSFELMMNNLAILQDPAVTRVNAVQYEDGLISIDREPRLGGLKKIEKHVIENLSTCVADLRNSIEAHLSKEGNCHWGSFSDIVCLSDALNLGFSVLKN